MKRSPIQRKTELKRGKPPQRKTRINPVSKKRAKLNQARRKFVEGFLAANPRCQAGTLITPIDHRHRCGRWSVDVHEVVTRARGGSILDPHNCRAICRLCHDWIHDNPADATEVGLLASRLPSEHGMDSDRP